MRHGFLDWSGNLGFDFDKEGTSRYIIFVLVATDNQTAIRGAVQDFRNKRSTKQSYRFHYTKERPQHRKAFFARLNGKDIAGSFIMGGLVIDKRQLAHNFRRVREPDFLAFFIAECVQPWAKELDGMRLLIDGKPKQDSQIRNAVRVELSHRGHRLNDVKMRPSRLEDGLQLADMLAGALREAVKAKWEQKRHDKQHDHLQSLRSWKREEQEREGYGATKKEGKGASPSALYVKLIPYGYSGD